MAAAPAANAAPSGLLICIDLPLAAPEGGHYECPTEVPPAPSEESTKSFVT